MKNNWIVVAAGIVLVLMVGIYGCRKQPEACFQVQKNSIALQEEARFTNCSEDAAAYEWDFGDGETSVQTSPTHKYAQPGTYTVSLQALSKNEKRWEKHFQTVTVREPVIPGEGSEVYTANFVIAPDDWIEQGTFGEELYGFYKQQEVSFLNREILDYGMVIVYVANEENWLALPVEFYWNGYHTNIQYEYSETAVRIDVFESDFQTVAPIADLTFKVVAVVPATNKKDSGPMEWDKINWKDYREVAKIFHLE